MTDVDDYDDNWGDDRDDGGEPNCGGCWDSGFALPKIWSLRSTSFTRERASRKRCASCNPSPRQERRYLKQHRRYLERLRHDVAAGRIQFSCSNEAPF